MICSRVVALLTGRSRWRSRARRPAPQGRAVGELALEDPRSPAALGAQVELTTEYLGTLTADQQAALRDYETIVKAVVTAERLGEPRYSALCSG